MLPGDGNLSATAVVAGSVDPVKRPGDFLVDYERGGAGINDPSQGLRVQIWTLRVVRNTANDALWDFVLGAEAVTPTVLFSSPDVTEAALAFDQNMRPFVAYVQAGVTKIWWYDPQVPGQVTTTLGSGFRSPRCTTDEKREWHLVNSDIQLWYVRGSNLCVRYQRERFQVEHIKKVVGPQAELVSATMTTNNRMVYRVRNSNVSASDPQVKVQVDPYLSDVVMDLCLRSGLRQEQVDVNDLYGQTVPGLKVNVDQGLDKPIDWLREIFNFDKSNADKKIRFVARGGKVKARIPYLHLLEGNPEALAVKIRDQSKLPKLVEIVHLDPTAGYAKNKQTAFRRTNTINATAKPKIETTVVLSPDQAATAAMIRLKKDWNELRDYTFSTGIRYAFLTETDIVEVEDSKGVWNRMRIEEKNEDDGEIKWTCVQDAGVAAYASAALGNMLDDPISTTPGLVGDTRIEIVNCSPLRDQDDELGVYIAAAGSSSAWTGFTMLISTDGGNNFTEAYEASSPATIGELTADLGDGSYEYPSNAQTARVVVNFPLSSANLDQVVSNANRCAIGDELLQYTSATLVGQPNGQYEYVLSGLVRGRYNTEPMYWPSGTRFVLLDESVVFVRAQQWMVGQDIEYKPVTFGSNVDETVATAYLYDDPQSQTEWPVRDVRAERISGTVQVAWIGRARLGMDTAPYHSKYFAGYRVKFGDGHIVDTPSEFASYAGAPGSVTVSVCALNSITGEGPYSDPITV